MCCYGIDFSVLCPLILLKTITKLKRGRVIAWSTFTVSKMVLLCLIPTCKQKPYIKAYKGFHGFKIKKEKQCGIKFQYKRQKIKANKYQQLISYACSSLLLKTYMSPWFHLTIKYHKQWIILYIKREALFLYLKKIEPFRSVTCSWFHSS